MRSFLIFLHCLFFFIGAQASHTRGGEITWQCLEAGPNMGKLVFTFKYFFACDYSQNTPPSSVAISNPLYATYGGTSSINCLKISTIDLIPKCDTGSTRITCGQATTFITSNFPLQEHTYRSQPVQINGVPSATGSEFSVSACCRPGSYNNGTASSAFFRSVMYPYFDVVSGQNMSMGSPTKGGTCYDSSPVFTEHPMPYGFKNKSNFFSIKSYDRDCDSLHYASAQPMQSSTSPLTWKTGYSTNSPLPSSSFNFNYNLSGSNGNAFYMIVIGDTGTYAMAQKVTSYRYGQKIAEVYRDYSLYLGVAATDNYSNNNNNPQIAFKDNASSAYTTTMNDTFNVGDFVHINIKAWDSDFLYGSTFQSVSLRLISDPAISIPFNPFGCKFSSCAYLDTNSLYWNNGEFKAPLQVFADFKWQIGCDALKPCLNSNFIDPQYKTYTFTVMASDNLCPMPLNSLMTFTLTIHDTSVVEGLIKKVVYQDSTVNIKWQKHKGSGFKAYKVYKSANSTGPFVLLDSLTNINDTTYVDSSALASAANTYYRLVSHGNFNCLTEENTVSSIYLEARDTLHHRTLLTFNPAYRQGSGNINCRYIIEADNGSGWQVLDSSGIYPNQLSKYTFYDSTNLCTQFIKYRVRAKDLDHDILYTSNVDSIEHLFPITPGFKTICQGDSVLLGTEYRKNPGSYLHTLQSSNGCDSMVNVTLKVNASYLIQSQEIICVGDSALIFGNYQTVPGIYQKKYKTNLGCDSLIKINLSIQNIDVTITSNTRRLKAADDSATYQWLTCPAMTLISGETGQTFTPASNGSYAVIVTRNSCSDTSKCLNVTAAGIELNDLTTDLLIFPNPGDNVVNFELKDLLMDAQYKLTIFDSKGGLMTSQVITSGMTKIQSSTWPEGIYYYQLERQTSLLHRGRFTVIH